MSELKVILLRGLEEDYREECKSVQERVSRIQSLLVEIANTGNWKLPVTVLGMETHFPEYEKDLELLERCGLIEGRVKYTERNSYRVYSLSEAGSVLVKNLV